MLRYLGLLVHFGWFKNVQLFSLSTGHIHEDIDQMFSTWHVHYWKSGFQSLLEISDFIITAYLTEATRPFFKMVQIYFAIKEWIKYFGISIKGHFLFRAFSLLKETNIGNVSLFYKNSSLDQS
jgi:hypothetical protein